MSTSGGVAKNLNTNEGLKFLWKFCKISRYNSTILVISDKGSGYFFPSTNVTMVAYGEINSGVLYIYIIFHLYFVHGSTMGNFTQTNYYIILLTY